MIKSKKVSGMLLKMDFLSFDESRRDSSLITTGGTGG
jgi:hypothetical protein